MIGKSRRQAADLPWEIICNIAARLPVKSLMRFKVVSKSWDNFTKDHYFLELQSNNPPSNCFILSKNSKNGCGLFLVDKQNQEWKMTAEIAPHPKLQANPHLKIVAACDGLLCFLDFQEFIIYNPITREIRDTPYPKDNSLPFQQLRVYYLLHDAKTKKYKLLLLVLSVGLGYIITIGETSWRKVEIPRAYAIGAIVGRLTIAPNGELCWIMIMFRKKAQILFMDIHDEKFRVTKIPDDICEEKLYHNPQDYYLFVHGKHVTLFATVLVPEQGFGRKVQVWELVDSKQGTWVRKNKQNKVFSQNVEVVSTVGADGLLLKLWSGSSDFPKRPSHFVIYNPESGNVSNILSPDEPKIYKLFSFTPSLGSISQ